MPSSLWVQVQSDFTHYIVVSLLGTEWCSGTKADVQEWLVRQGYIHVSGRYNSIAGEWRKYA